MPVRPLNGRVAVVSGANHGIGAATAARLAHLGADIAVTFLAADPSRRDPAQPDAYHRAREQGPDAALAAIAAAGRRGLAVEADLSDAAAPARIFAEAEATLGPVSILVNNASAWHPDSFAAGADEPSGRQREQVGAGTATTQLLVDVWGGALMIAELAASVRRHGLGWGRIVSLTSGGPMGFPSEVSYGAAKAALENFTMSASVELASEGITANVIYPPVTDTGWVTPEVRDFVAHSPEHVHISQPDEVAEVIGWLCTAAAHVVTGNLIRLR